MSSSGLQWRVGESWRLPKIIDFNILTVVFKDTQEENKVLFSQFVHGLTLAMWPRRERSVWKLEVKMVSGTSSIP